MTFLELVRKLALRTGAELQANIDANDVELINALGEGSSYGEGKEHTTRLVDWIQQAWVDLQRDQPFWNWRSVRGAVTVVEDQVEYDLKDLIDTANAGTNDLYERLWPFVAPLDNRYIWFADTSLSPKRPQPLYYIPFSRFVGGPLDRRNPHVKGKPSHYTINRAGNLVLDTLPEAGTYEIRFDFVRAIHNLTNEEDVPAGLPENYHMLIVYYAMVDSAMFDESNPQLQRALRLKREMLAELRNEYTPEYSMAGTFT